MNPYIYNPAYAGVEGHSVVFAMHKAQWANTPGAPTLSHVNFHVPLRGGLAFGALAYRESIGPYVQSGGKISAGYLINIDREHFFRFGMSLGAGNNSGEFSPETLNDVSFVPQEVFYIGDVGATYHFDHFNIGVALPSLFSYEYFNQEKNENIRIRPHDHVLVKTNYRGHLNDNIAIEPHLLYRYSRELPDQIEATVILHLLHIVWVGGSYRKDAGLVGLLGLKVKESLGIGYSYEYGNPTLAKLAGPTHEVHIGYHIGTRKEHAEHVSSFIKSHRKSAEERAKDAELERQRKLQALQDSRKPKTAEADEDELSLVAAPKKEQNTDIHWSYEQESDPVERINEFGETERGIKFDRINENGEKEVVFSWLPPPPPGAKEEKYQIADPTHEPLIRTRPDGTKEAGIKWIRVVDGGEPETLIIWDEIMTAEEADQLDHSPSTALSLDQAVISITGVDTAVETPVITTPEPDIALITTEPPTVEDTTPPLNEEPVAIIKEKPITKPLPDIQPAVSEPNVVVEPEEQTPEPVTVKRGTHMLELPAGYYVVAGAFRSFQNAEDHSDLLFERGYHDTKVGYLTAKDLYYVVIFNSPSAAGARKERDRVRTRAGMSGTWVLKVSE